MRGEENFQKLLTRRPHVHLPNEARPLLSRRQMFRIAGTGLTGSYLTAASATEPALRRALQSKAKAVIAIRLTGAPSHIDTFDLKMTSGITPSNFNATRIKDVLWPTGVMPKLAGQLDQIAIVRSCRAWALVHSLAQTWQQIGRSPVAALGNVAPNIGSVVALEKEPERKAGQVFPAFLALNANTTAGSGFLDAKYAPFKALTDPEGLGNTENTAGQARMETRFKLLQTLDGPNRTAEGGNPRQFPDYDAFTAQARGLMYNPVVDKAFSFSASDSARYGGSTFGDACLVAKQVLAANQGTRFIEILHGSWDTHDDIYSTTTGVTSIYTLGKELDGGLSELLKDLSSSGLLSETLVVVGGEFGRTPGKLTEGDGRDHYLQHFVAFAGAGVVGGRAIGATDPEGSDTTSFGWSQDRYVRQEDIEATIYSALGIDYTKELPTAYGRTFEYVPSAKAGLYAPIDELWG